MQTQAEPKPDRTTTPRNAGPNQLIALLAKRLSISVDIQERISQEDELSD
jgi:hypothetical protein